MWTNSLRFLEYTVYICIHLYILYYIFFICCPFAKNCASPQSLPVPIVALLFGGRTSHGWNLLCAKFQELSFTDLSGKWQISGCGSNLNKRCCKHDSRTWTSATIVLWHAVACSMSVALWFCPSKGWRCFNHFQSVFYACKSKGSLLPAFFHTSLSIPLALCHRSLVAGSSRSPDNKHQRHSHQFVIQLHRSWWSEGPVLGRGQIPFPKNPRCIKMRCQV